MPVRPSLVAVALTLACSPALAEPPAPPSGPTVPDGLGFNLSMRDEEPGELAMLRASGATIVRRDLWWHDTEREPGVYDFSAYDKLLAEFERHGLRTIWILCYTNRQYDDDRSPDTDVGRAAFARWAAAAATHYRGRDVVFEVYNEPNILPFWRPRPNTDDYVKLAVETTRAIRAADPQAVIVGPATAGVPLPFLEACFKAGLLEHWSAVTVHSYRQGGPESAEGDYRALRNLIRRHAPAGKAVPIWSGEWGYSATFPSFDADKAGQMLPRQWLFNRSQGVPVSIWYQWRDGSVGEDAEQNFGVVAFAHTGDAAHPFRPLPAYRAARTLTRQLGGFTYNKRLWTGDARDWVLLFTRGDEVRVAAWTTADEPRDFALPAGDGLFAATSRSGDPLPDATAGGGRLAMRLTCDVQYLVPRDPDATLTAVARVEPLPLDLVVTAPASAPDDSVVTRGDDGKVFAIEHTVGAGVTVAQALVASVTNPLRLAIRPLARGAEVQVENPSGVAFVGHLRAGATGRLLSDVRIEGGQTRWSRALPDLDASRRFEVALCADERTPVVATLDGLLIPAMPADLRVSADGDPKVAAEVAAGRDLSRPDEVALRYRFDAGWKYAELRPVEGPVPIPDGAAALGMWVRGDGTGNLLRMRFEDASGETWQPDGPAVTWGPDEQRYVEFPLDGSGAGHWGGDVNGRVDGPRRLTTLALIDSAARQVTLGTIVVGQPTWVIRR